MFKFMGDGLNQGPLLLNNMNKRNYNDSSF